MWYNKYVNKRNEVFEMKRTKEETKWYLFTDGKKVSVTNSLTEVSTLRGAIINITANEAATILALMLERKNESEVCE